MILLLLACAGDPEAPPADTGPGLPEVSRPELEAAWSPEQTQEALQSALDLGLPWPWDMHGYYQALIAQGDARCPGEGGQISGEHLWGCTSASGVWYAGVTELIEDVVEEGACWSGARILIGDVVILDTEGRRFAMGGHVLENLADDPEAGGREYTQQLSGSMLYEAAEGAFQEPVSGLLTARLLGEAEGAREGLFDGSVSAWGRALELRELRAVEDTGCGLRWSGELRIREPEGAWHALVLDGDCGGCGALQVLGQEGEVEVCVQPEALMTQLLARAEGTCTP